MTFIFICGSLDIGNGVGDYVRAIGKALALSGNQVILISLADVDNSRYDRFNSSSKIEIHRMSKNSSWRSRNSSLNIILEAFKPEVVSIQFVPYSFNKRGLPLSFFLLMIKMKHRYRFHIMFHELWVDYQKASTLSHKVIGRVQKILIKLFLKFFKPALVTTSTPKYMSYLRKFDPQMWPVFSNIAKNHDCPERESNSSNVIRIAHFGSFTNDVEGFISQMTWLTKLKENLQVDLKFFIIGKPGHNKERCMQILKSNFGEDNIDEFGMMEPSEISCLLAKADLGLSRASYDDVGKSGTTAAMIDHELPILLRGDRPENMNGELEGFVFSNDYPAIPERRKLKISQLEATANAFLAEVKK